MNSLLNKVKQKRDALSEGNKSLVSNLLSLAFLQGANYVLPLITLPYLVRVLGADKFGLISFAQALVGYFIILTDYGFNLSATKETSIHKNDIRKISELFWTVLLIKLTFFIVGFLIFYFIVQAVEPIPKERTIYYASYGIVLGHVIFPTWFFQGMERMKYITIVNIASKVIFTLLIFVYVREAADYQYVPIITSLGYLIGGGIALGVSIVSFKLNFFLPTFRHVLDELKNGFSIFLTSVSSNIISSSGIVVLGLFQSKEIVGYYSAVEKLAKVFVTAFSPITQAIFPRVAYKFSISKTAGKKVVLNFGKYTMLLALLASLTLAFFHEQMVAILYDETFVAYSYLLQLLAIWLFFGVLNNFIGIQFLVGSGHSALYGKIFTVASAVTLFTFVLFTKTYSINAIVAGILAGEVVLTALMAISIYRLNLHK